MDQIKPFSDYDVFAYLASGFALLAAVDFLFGSHWVLGADWSVSSGTLIVFAAYVMGQILATPAAWLLERNLVRKALTSPSKALFVDHQDGWRRVLQNTLLQDYYTPLDSFVRARVLRCAKAEGYTGGTGEGLFWLAYPVAKNDDRAYARMSSFLNLYSFCRNFAFVALVIAIAIIVAVTVNFPWSGISNSAMIQQWWSTASNLLQWAGVSALLGLGMFHRYLKFYRLYAVEVFVTYGSRCPHEN